MKRETIVEKMKDHTPAIIGKQNLTEYSILLPLIEKDGELHLVFEVRSQKMRRQPGEVCFPGGKVDAEDWLKQDTATREAEEELGITHDEISDIYPFDYIVSPFGMIVNTYVGFLSCAENRLQPNPDEVDEVFTVPLSYFMETKPHIHYVNVEVKPQADFPFHLIENGRDYRWQTKQLEELFYIYDDRVIWGLTARVLYYFVQMIQSSGME
ncbi:CoA pyrophosphatase [Thalassobacillus sp. CUG 92003]|uniref:NUDIX hydrolase n=1 Tax=Thalassobacillus sp. CUG 92003 TaxID=2736641 RepID=UPI0015E728FB|nr:CoA pyrophosphatase [Thalassobacillus sp. CUG 92003]